MTENFQDPHTSATNRFINFGQLRPLSSVSRQQTYSDSRRTQSYFMRVSCVYIHRESKNTRAVFLR